MLASISRIIVLYLLVDNYVFGQLLGLCPLIGVSLKTETAISMGMAVFSIITIASVVTHVLQIQILERFYIEHLRVMVPILVIVTLVQFVETTLKKIGPNLYSALDVFLPLIITNCIVLGVALTNVKEKYNLIEVLANAIGISLDFILAITLSAATRERTAVNKNIPENFRGVPITLVTIGLMAMTFFGFDGLT